MKTRSLFRMMFTMAVLAASAAASAESALDAEIARAKQEYDAALQTPDVGLRNSKKIQLAVLQARANEKGAKSAPAVEMPPLAKELNCVACHAIDHKVVGPAWQDVANKYTGAGVTTYVYQGKSYPLIEGLVMKVSKGGFGNWGSMPMPANDPAGTRKDKIRQLVEFEQSLARK